MYSNITGNPALSEAIRLGKVYKEYGIDSVEGISNYVEVEPEESEDENELHGIEV